MKIEHWVDENDPTVMHSWALLDDGRQMDGSVGWGSLEQARLNYDNARRSFARQAERVNAGEADPAGASRLRKIRTPIGTFAFFRNAGPPTWWLPKAGVARDAGRLVGVKFGWLRRTYSITRSA